MDPKVLLELVNGLEQFKNGLEQLQNSLLGVVNTVKPFVDALAPSVVQEFNQAMRDLYATIGVALIGIVQVASSVVREIGGVILPLMQQLEPIITALANAVGTGLVSLVRLLVVPLQIIVPLLDILVGFMSEYEKLLSDVIGITTALAKVFADLVALLFGTSTGNIKDTMKAFFDILRQVVKALVTFAATLAVTAGAAGLVNKFADALGKEAKDRDAREGGLKAAGTNPQITDIANIARAAQLAAFTAQGASGGREKTDTEFLKELSGDLKKIANDSRGLEERLRSWWDDQVVGGSGIFGKVLRFIDAISSTIAAGFLFLSKGLRG